MRVFFLSIILIDISWNASTIYLLMYNMVKERIRLQYLHSSSDADFVVDLKSF